MKFIYDFQFQQAFHPGDRAWASGFRVTANERKIIRNRKPALVEICAGHKRDNENSLRAAGHPAAYIVPLNADGTLRFRDASTWADMEFSDTEEQARDSYRASVVNAHAVVGREIRRLKHIKAEIKKLIKETGIDPDSLEDQ